ncbi:hypothetical protein [Streptomyces capoamus]|uniref:hypothetical protein n=1 Tax=Streptomyces capoamus TaxID=68183 RepID=UPI001674677F|nr:hypothetical protein [Streptomyces capoamus]
MQEIGAALLHTADDADPMAASLFRDGNGPDEIAAMLAAVEPAVQSPADRAAEELAKHFAQAIWALKSPPPPGSEHYRSGWDDGLEAAIDAARDVLLRRLAGEQPTNSEARPDDTIHACPGRWGGPSCRCFDKEQPTNSEARDAPDQVVAYVLAERVDLHCPRCAPTPTGDVWTPVTAEELEDGGICTVCGRDVLIPAPSV